MADTNKKTEPQDKEFKVTEKEADRWSVPDDFGIDPRIIAARLKKTKPQ